MVSVEKTARNTERGQIQPIRSVDQGQHKYIHALMVRLHDRLPGKYMRSGFCARCARKGRPIRVRALIWG